MRKLISYLPAIVWAALVLSIGGLNNVPAPQTGLPLDKVAHFAMYAVLGALAAGGWLRAGRFPPAAVPVVLAMAVGAFDEFHQRSVAGRSAELADLVADVAGVAAGFTFIARRKRASATGTE